MTINRINWLSVLQGWSMLLVVIGHVTFHIQFSHAAIHVHFRISVLPDKNRAEQEIRGDHRRQGKKVADPLCRIHLRNVLSEICLQSANETAGRLFMVGNPRHSYV